MAKKMKNPEALLEAIGKLLQKKSNRRILVQAWTDANKLDEPHTNLESMLIDKHVVLANKGDIIYMTLSAEEIRWRLPQPEKLSNIRIGRYISSISEVKSIRLNGLSHYKVKEIIKNK